MVDVSKAGGLEREGFERVRAAMERSRIEVLAAEADRLLSDRAGARQLLSESAALRDIAHGALRELAGPKAFPVRGLLFDKHPDANWGVQWHQDRTIAVREKHDLPGFGPWTVKAGIPHVHAPAEVLESMVTLRLHLDPAGEHNGALSVIPGSHRSGVLGQDEIAGWLDKRGAVMCGAEAGDVLIMRPLVLHASLKAEGDARRRRVIHIEYAFESLPEPLAWMEPGV